MLRASVSTNECDWLTQRPFFALKVTWIVLGNFRFWIHFGWIWIQNGNFKVKNASVKFSNFGSRPMSLDRKLSEPSGKLERKKKNWKKNLCQGLIIIKLAKIAKFGQWPLLTPTVHIRDDASLKLRWGGPQGLTYQPTKFQPFTYAGRNLAKNRILLDGLI